MGIKHFFYWFLNQFNEHMRKRQTLDDITVLDTSNESINDDVEEPSSILLVEKGNEDGIWDMDDELENLDPEAHKALESVKEEISRTEPNVKVMLITPMRLEDRAKLYQYYEIYKMQDSNTNEWLECRHRYNDMFKEYKAGFEQHRKYSESDIQRMEAEEKQFTGFDAQLSLKYKILNLETCKENKEVIYRRYEELLRLESTDEEYGKLKNWLKWATDVPHDRIKEIKVDNVTVFIKKAKAYLDKELHGMNKVKEQILIFLSAKVLNPSMKRSNLGLVGDPGVGKTRIARLIAEIMDWGFAQISLGGVEKVDFLKGHEYTYVGAQPGEIIKKLKEIGHKNGVIFLDEVEKAAENPYIRAALLHIIDPIQNSDFRDHFLSKIKTDLSHIWFIGSMNKIPSDKALADRWWIITVDGYSSQDKVKIMEDYLMPKALKNCGMVKNSISFKGGSASTLITKVCGMNDRGVRTIEKYIGDLVNKVNFLVTHQGDNGKLPFKTSFEFDKRLEYPVLITHELIDKLLDSKVLDNMMYI